MFLSRVVPVTVVLVAVGCNIPSVLRLDAMPRPQTNPDSIQLIAQEPQQPYTVIALVSVSSRGWPFEGIPTSRLLKTAARLGGDAVLLDNASLTVAGGDESRQHVLTGKVIAFKR